MRTKQIFLVTIMAIAIAVVSLTGCATSGGTSSASSSATSSAASASSTSSSAASSSSTQVQKSDKHYTLYLGTNDKDTNQPVFSHEGAKEHAKAILIKEFGGYTIQEADGGWISDDGIIYQEYTLVIHLSDTDLDSVHTVAKKLIDEFHQSSILISTENVMTEFYDGTTDTK